MRHTRLAVAGCIFLFATLMVYSTRPAAAARAEDQQQQAPSYSVAEYNAYTAASKETDAKKRVALLDDFVAKFPKSTLLPYVYTAYYAAYFQLQDYPKVIEYADMVSASADKFPEAERTGTLLQALLARCQAFTVANNPKAPDATDQMTKERDAAQRGLQLLGQLAKPANMTDAQFAEQKKPAMAIFSSAAGYAQLQLKDYKGAADSFKIAAANKPDDGLSDYYLGLAYLSMSPPQQLDGFWALARAVDLNVAGAAQVKDYLRKQVIVYQQTGCDNLVDAQLNALLTLAQNAPDRPATYSIPSVADLDKVRQGSDFFGYLNDLKAGGDKAQLTWLAICGSEFPNVVGKIIDVKADADAFDFMVFTGPTPDEVEKATDANMEVKVTGQPDVSRLGKDDGIRFTGTLVSYDPQPFMLHWDKVKVDPTIIPEEKPTPGKKRPRKPGA